MLEIIGDIWTLNLIYLIRLLIYGKYIFQERKTVILAVIARNGKCVEEGVDKCGSQNFDM